MKCFVQFHFISSIHSVSRCLVLMMISSTDLTKKSMQIWSFYINFKTFVLIAWIRDSYFSRFNVSFKILEIILVIVEVTYCRICINLYLKSKYSVSIKIRYSIDHLYMYISGLIYFGIRKSLYTVNDGQCISSLLSETYLMELNSISV